MPRADGCDIFISYRRHESSHLAGQLHHRLAGRFGEGQVFIDVDAIEPGVDFAEEILRALAACRLLLAIIGPNWLTATDQQGRRRIDDPGDVVRLEIEAALARDVPVIPILVEGAVMPGRPDLPESLARLARRNAFHVRRDSFRSDAGRLVTVIERILADPGAGDARGVRPAGDALGKVAQTGTGPARNDRARAARLLDGAERIARSITRPRWIRNWTKWAIIAGWLLFLIAGSSVNPKSNIATFYWLAGNDVGWPSDRGPSRQAGSADQAAQARAAAPATLMGSP
jgi:hypothetical protein